MRKHTKEDLERILLLRREIDENGCWLWTGSLRYGYGQIMVAELGRPCTVSRVAAWLWMDFDLHSKLLVCHIDDCNRRCFNPDHLYVGTMSDNAQDSWRKRQNARRRETFGTEDRGEIRRILRSGVL